MQAPLLSDMPAAVRAAEPGAGDPDEAVLAGIGLAIDRRTGNRGRRADRTAYVAGSDACRPKASVGIVPAVVAVLPVACMGSPTPRLMVR